MSKPTLEYIEKLSQLGVGHRALLRACAMSRLDNDVRAFDLFSGLWWPLRQKSPQAPERESAWIIAKLYCAFPLEHERSRRLARELGRIARAQPNENLRKSIELRFDQMLTANRSNLEEHLRWALLTLCAHQARKLDWVALTDDLWKWNRDPSVKTRWARDYLGLTAPDEPDHMNPSQSQEPPQNEKGDLEQ
ncbi:MAG: type I-E CRISPR-associated protein Cse2/CasB [Candidatus Sumerlaea chitinivorans]|nr:type I-E CRISPR-associated protein Cse2/CasB [Candidatus Sumerlaea chitinivorans]